MSSMKCQKEMFADPGVDSDIGDCSGGGGPIGDPGQSTSIPTDFSLSWSAG